MKEKPINSAEDNEPRKSDKVTVSKIIICGSTYVLRLRTVIKPLLYKAQMDLKVEINFGSVHKVIFTVHKAASLT